MGEIRRLKVPVSRIAHEEFVLKTRDSARNLSENDNICKVLCILGSSVRVLKGY